MLQTPLTVSGDFIEQLLDKYLALRDVLGASDLLQELVDPLVNADVTPGLPDINRAGLASMLRIVNRDFAVWLHGLESLLLSAGVTVPPPD